MIIVYPSRHVRHHPPNEIFNGNRDPHEEVPERIERIKASLEDLEGLHFILPCRFALSWIERVHDHAYVDYLADAGRAAGATYVYPSVFPYGEGQRATHPVGIRGQYSFDMYTPISSTTYEAARGSAMTALTAASYLRRGERVVYALCRPPGHHALRSRMGGYCYFNNAAIAAEYLNDRGRVAILDIDVHHGNGTQDIFYSRPDVLVVNIHADPDELFPYFSGREEEQGKGAGIGYNMNFPLPLKTEDAVYDRALRVACARIRSFAPVYLVVSVGYDAHVDDPIGGLHLTTAYYYRIGQTLAELGIPTVLIQEGGYNTETLGTVAQTFIRGWIAH
ncbi:histone deacetylase family protein [Candidatus Gottesmanbacteria bacterium]|nr:histone deacetylase family protein [Candidatus Gottesmanbacteria bacterium]